MIKTLTTAAHKSLPRTQFARSVTMLVGGTAGAQLILVGAAPVLTRLYTPGDFGALALFVALLAFAGVVASLRYELTIPLPEKDEDAANLATLSAMSVLLITILTAVLIYFFGSSLSAALDAPHLDSHLWLLPIGVFVTGMYQTFEKWSVRTKSFKTITQTKLAQALTSVTIQLAGFNFGALGLVAGQVTGQGMGSGRLALGAIRNKAFRSVNLADIRRLAARYCHFPIYSTWTALFNTASIQLAPIIFVVFLGTTVAGLYALTLRILTLPLNLIGNAIGSVFLAHAPQARREGKLPELVQSLHLKLTLFGLPLLFLILYTAPDFFRLAFGDQWEKAGEYARWMAPWIYLQLQLTPLSTLTSVLELQKEALFAQIFSLTVRSSSLGLAIFLGATSDNSILTFAISSAFVYLSITLWLFHRCGIGLKRFCLNEIKRISIFGLISAPAGIIYLNGSLIAIIISGFLFVVSLWFWMKTYA